VTKLKLIKKIRDGNVTDVDLVAAGAIQRGLLSSGEYGLAGCPSTGAGCVDLYAVSIAGVLPSRFINWFQAVATARNSGKRLPTNQEWQAAALGTPDPGVSAPGSVDCNTSNGGGFGVDEAVLTASRSSCVSDVGAYDMVGNIGEWVADWAPVATACPGWGIFSDDLMCFAGADATAGPGALIRGGNFGIGTSAGILAVDVLFTPLTTSFQGNGFRAAR
jgi:hypothetical protein